MRWAPWNLTHTGGMSGQIVHQFLSWLAGDLGAFLISLFSSLALAMWIFKWNFVSATTQNFRVWLFQLREKRAAFANRVREQIKLRLTAFRENREKKKTPPIGVPVAAGMANTPNPSIIEIPKPAIQLPLPLNNPNQEIKVENTPPISTERSAEDEELIKVLNPDLGKEKIPSSKVKIPKKININFQLPQLSMLSGKAEAKTKPVDKNWYLEKAQILVEKLKDFGVEGEVVHISPGPVITVYEFKPASEIGRAHV